MMLSFFPTLLVLSWALAGSRTTAALAREITYALNRVLPPMSRQMALQYFSGETEHSGNLIFWSASIALFAASGVTGSFVQGFRAAYKLRYDWSIWHEEGLCLALVFMAGTPLLAATILIVFGAQVQNWLVYEFGFPELIAIGWAAVRWLVAVSAGTLVLMIMYYLSPHCEERFSAVFPGALLATFAWLGTTAAFGWYVQNVAQYSGIYGSLGTGVALMIWMYLGAVIVLLGAQFNAAYERLRRGEQSQAD
jgi:membrane protein